MSFKMIIPDEFLKVINSQSNVYAVDIVATGIGKTYDDRKM